MNRILKYLTSGLDYEEREEVERRYKMMVSEMSYILETKPKLLRSASRLGWSPSKIEAVFCLNSFYQRILAPLVASASDPHVVGDEIPIRFGESIRFDAARSHRMREMENAFYELCFEAEIQPFMLEAQQAGDLIWRLANPKNSSGNETDNE